MCDEPTGALDTVTSVQIMDLIKKLSGERLVIMVTHNPQLAEEYADRIIRFQDGKIVSDSHPHQERPKPDSFKLRKTSMNFLTALNLSFNNIKTKKGRTFLTSFASSIGIIGIAVILSLSSGFRTTIDDFQRDAMAQFPVLITQNTAEMDLEQMRKEMGQRQNLDDDGYADSQEVYLKDPSSTIKQHTNVFSEEYLNYLSQIDPSVCSSVGLTRIVNMNLLRETEEGAVPVTFSSSSGGSESGGNAMMSGMESMGISSFPRQLQEEDSYLEQNYELLAGEYPDSPEDMVLVVGKDNTLDQTILKNLGFPIDGRESVKFADIVGAEFRIVSNDDYYVKTEYGFLPGEDYQAMYDSDRGITVRISGIVRISRDAGVGVLSAGVAYSDELTQKVIELQENSEIVKAQRDSDRNVMTQEELDADGKKQFLAYLGGDSTPYMIMMYPNSFESKDEVIAYLDAWNMGKDDGDMVVYTDMVETISNMTGSIMDGITVVLIAFAAISLVVSMIMICIIIYTSVLERTKEIGILRALGARKRDITHVFDAETFLLGLFSGVLGVVIAWLFTFPINVIIENMTGLAGVAHLQLLHAVLLVAVSTVLTMLGGHIPARIASKKDAVEALRSE